VTLHVEDLALARQCAAGEEKAWDRFVLEYRPILYRAADALDPSGGAREIADSLYADLYVMQLRDGERRSLFHYFHGRSSLATWLRAVLAQRYVDRIRAHRRFESLPDEAVGNPGFSAPAPVPDPGRDDRLRRLRRALAAAVARLSARDRLRLGCYYRQDLTLAETGRVMREHEATVSRQLARARRVLRDDVERQLRADGLSVDEIAASFAAACEDAGPLDLAQLLPEGRAGVPAAGRVGVVDVPAAGPVDVGSVPAADVGSVPAAGRVDVGSVSDTDLTPKIAGRADVVDVPAAGRVDVGSVSDTNRTPTVERKRGDYGRKNSGVHRSK